MKFIPNKLFALLLGGKHPNALLELHDIRFTLAVNKAEAFRNVKGTWFGEQKSAHVDAWLDLSVVDGFELTDRSSSEPGCILYFVNLGSYRPKVFNEDHHYFFLIAKNPSEVKTRVKQELTRGNLLPHFDNLEKVDLILPLKKVDSQVLFWKKTNKPSSVPSNGYWPLSKI